MHTARRLLVILAAGVALTLAAVVPAQAVPGTSSTSATDPAGDLPNLGGTKADRVGYAGLDLLRVSQSIRGDRLVVVAKFRNLTRANTRTNPDRTPIGESMTMFAVYFQSSRNLSGRGPSYTASFGRDRTVSLGYGAGHPVPCPVAARRSTIDLERDRVRYVVPVDCLSELSVVHTTAQAIRYKVIKRDREGMEHLNLLTLDQNDDPLRALALR